MVSTDDNQKNFSTMSTFFFYIIFVIFCGTSVIWQPQEIS